MIPVRGNFPQRPFRLATYLASVMLTATLGLLVFSQPYQAGAGAPSSASLETYDAPAGTICMPIAQRETLLGSGLMPNGDITIPDPNNYIDAPSLLTVDSWEVRFLSVWQQEHEDHFDGWSRGEDSYWYYFLAYGVDGNTAMYLATGNHRYLDRALYYVNNVIAEARISSTMANSQYKDGYLGWISQRDNFREISLREAYLWRYVTRLLQVIRLTPDLYNDAAYRAQYEAILEFSEVQIFEKWYTRSENNIYRTHTNLVAHWGFITLDLSLLTTDPQRQALYEEVYAKINQELRDQIIPNSQDDTSYFWNDLLGSFDLPGQDTNHSNNVVAYMVHAFDRGVYWNSEDMIGLRNLLLNVLWNGDLENTSFSGYLDGSSPEEGLVQGEGYLKLGRYFPEVQHIYENYVGDNVYMTQYYGNAALNARILALNGCLG